jgi:hypothetical protein
VIFSIVLLTFSPPAGFSEDANRIDMETLMRFTVSDETDIIDADSALIDLEFLLGFADIVEGTFELKANMYDVMIGELSATLKAWDYLHLKGGKFENALTLDEYMPAWKRPFARKSLASDFLDRQGYVTRTMSGMAYKKYKKDTLPISYLVQGSYIPAHKESQFDMGLFYHFDGKDSYLGILASYFPFFNDRHWAGGIIEEKSHNFVIDLICASYENDLVCGGEFTFGSSLVDPIGIINFPIKEDRSYFMAADLHFGYLFDFSVIQWLPAIRFTILFPEIAEMEVNQMEVILGNLLVALKNIKFHADIGICVNSEYSAGTLYTNLEFLWALTLMLRV